MERKREIAYRFSYCLYAYLYKNIHRKIELPREIDYDVPKLRFFSKNIGETVLEIYENFQKFLVPSFSKIFPQICLSEEYFFEYVTWYFKNTSVGFTDDFFSDWDRRFSDYAVKGSKHLKFLILCAFITSLASYCFSKGCFSFTPSAPTCLAEIILKMPDMYSKYETLTDGLIDLNQFCTRALRTSGFDLCNLDPLLKQQAEYLNENASSNFQNIVNELSSIGGNGLTLSKKNIAFSIESLNECLMDFKKFNVHDDESKFGTSEYSNEFNANMYYEQNSENLEEPDIFGLNEIRFDCDPTYTDAEEFCGPNLVELTFGKIDYSKITNSPEVCIHCNYNCLVYLEEFIDDFKATNYESD